LKNIRRKSISSTEPKVLVFDVETAPILASVWKIWEENVGLNQINRDWSVIAWAAKWLGDGKVMYQDARHSKNIEDDSKLLKGIWDLLNEADIVITQNGKQFDSKKLNARFVINGFKPPSPYKHIDTREIAKRNFGFTSNKLEYMSDKLCKKFKKLKHEEFGGFDLWKSCLEGDQKAWKVMEKYNKHDVLALEELYQKLSPWDRAVNFDLYRDGEDHICNCGSTNVQKRGVAVTAAGKYQRFQCQDCGTWTRSKENLLSKEKRKSLNLRVSGAG
jgi:DNA polymerase elongation subunit (family B)